jgi:4-amino-4-deoxy-L-arabinose transferase-like glycosyltransferase
VTDWLLLGLAVGIALWAKYFVVLLVVPYALFLLFDREARRALVTPGPCLALLIAAIGHCAECRVAFPASPP